MSVITAIVIWYPQTCTLKWAYLTPLEPTVFIIAKHYNATTIVFRINLQHNFTLVSLLYDVY